MAKARPTIGGRLTGLLQGVEEFQRPADSQLALDQLRPGRFQPRLHFAPDELATLARSLSEHGVLQPLLVRPLGGEQYEIVAGERRWRAAQLAGLAAVPVHIRPLSDAEARLASAMENLHRTDLNPLEEAFAKLNIAAAALNLPPEAARARMFALSRHPELDQEAVTRLDELFAQMGRESWRSFIKNRAGLFQLPEDVQLAVQGGLDYRKALVIGRVDDAEARARLLEQAQDGATVQELRRAVQPPTEPDEMRAAAHEVVRRLSSPGTLRAMDRGRRDKLRSLLQQVQALLEA